MFGKFAANFDQVAPFPYIRLFCYSYPVCIVYLRVRVSAVLVALARVGAVVEASIGCLDHSLR